MGALVRLREYDYPNPSKDKGIIEVAAPRREAPIPMKFSVEYGTGY